MNRPDRHQIVVLVSVVLATCALAIVPRVLELDETLGLYWLFQMRGEIPAPADVAVISIDGESAGALGLSSLMTEWPRDLHARLLDGLVRSGAAVVAFDIIFDRPREVDRDRRFAQAIANAGNVILLERVRTREVRLPGVERGMAELESRVLPLEPFRQGALATAPFTLPVVPVRVGQYWVFGRGPGDSATLPAVTLAAYLRAEHDRLLARWQQRAAERTAAEAAVLNSQHSGQLQARMSALRAALRDAPDLARQLRQDAETDAELALVDLYAGPDSRYLNYYGPPRAVATYPYHEVLQALDEGGTFEALRGRVVLVGFSESHQPEQQDSFYSVYSDASGLNLSGVEIAATALANLLQRHEIRPLSVPGQAGVALLWGLALTALCLMFRMTVALALSIAAAAAYLWTAGSAFSATGLWLPLVAPVAIQWPAVMMTALLLAYRRTRRQGRRVREALGYYVPAQEVERLTRESLRPGRDSTLLHGACLVTDADEYTKLAETMNPQVLARLLNDYYAALFAAVRRYGGQIADVAGDSMVAVWTEAQPDADTRRQACLASLAVQRAAEAFNRQLGHGGLPTRVGLDAGQLALGNIGAGSRYEYRAVGSIVNTASRLQGLNRQLGTRVLASAATVAELGDLRSRFLGTFVLVGKAGPVPVHELYEWAGDRDQDTRRNALFASALGLFQTGDWAAAALRFSQVLAAHPGDGPARFYLELANRYDREPPGEWTGTVTVTAK